MGHAISALFAKEGARIAIGDIDQDKAEMVAAEIEESGGKALAVRVNVADEEEVEGLVEKTLQQFESLDVLVNCVGVGEYLPAEEITGEHWRRMIDVDLSGTFYCCREAGKEMIKRKQGKIVNISSTAGIAGVPYMSHYTAAKHGVVGLTRALATEWGKYNVNVNCICPGATLTPLILNATTPQYREDRMERTPLCRLAEPLDQAKVALFLASSDADYVTGAIIGVDGGISALAPSTSRGALRGET